MPEYNFTFDWNRITTIGKVKILVEQVVGSPSQAQISQAVADYIDSHPGSLSPISQATKSALLDIAEHVAYIDANGQSRYDALDAALNAKALLSITAVYTQSVTVYDTDSLDSLKSDLVVTAYYDDGTSADVTSASVLSGTLTEGTSTITATYQEKTATFNVTVTHYELEYITDGLIHRWDGIQNTANGHDSSAATWKDLIGTYDLELVSTSALTWNNDSLSFSGATDSYARSATGNIESAVNKTVEIVLEPSQSAVQTVAQPFCEGVSTTDAIGKVNIFSDNTVSTQGKSAVTYNTGLSATTAVRSIVGTFTSTPAVNKVYVNGAEATVSSKTHSMKNTYNRMIVGASKSSDSNNGYQFTGKIYAIRIYNRNLTAEEIAQNYATDVQRFGLE